MKSESGVHFLTLGQSNPPEDEAHIENGKTDEFTAGPTDESCFNG